MIKNNPKKYTLDVDSVLLAFSVLRKLNAGKIDKFEDRLKSQKIQYLAQVFGVSPAYNFGLYIRGPYSAGLANDLFKIAEDKLEPDLSDFIPNILQDKFNKLNEFIKDKNNRQLELITTLHLLIKVMKYEVEQAVKKITEWKQATSDEINYSFSELEKIS